MWSTEEILREIGARSPGLIAERRSDENTDIYKCALSGAFANAVEKCREVSNCTEAYECEL
jgi:hypothetical protein